MPLPPPSVPGPLSVRRRTSFILILFVLSSLVLALSLEAGLRLIDLQVPYDPYIHFGTVPNFFVRKIVDGREVFQVAHRDVYSERAVQFAAKKEPGTLRVICVGASASAGWPHAGEEIYSAYLQQALQRAYPQRRVEVLNLSAHAYAAYRVRMVFQEALQFEPDLFVIWSGNNEFLEQRTYVDSSPWRERLEEWINHFLAYRAIRGSRIGRYLWPESTLSAHEREHQIHAMWSKLEQVAITLRTDPVQFSGVQRHYRASLESMIEQAAAAAVPVVLATVPVNLRDWTPVVSCHGGTASQGARWQAEYLAGRKALADGAGGEAVTHLTAAVALDPQFADGYFYLGRALEAQGQMDEAYGAYSQARDYDCNPFRAISAFEETVRALGARYRNVVLVDLVHSFRAAVAPRPPGFNLFLDYVHPTKSGNLIAAESVYRAIQRSGALPAFPKETGFMYVDKPLPATGLPYDDWTDVPMLLHLLRFYMIQHQNEAVLRQSQTLLAQPALRVQLTDKDRAFLERTVAVFGAVVQREQEWIHGRATDPTEVNRASLLEFYQQYFEGYQEYKQKYGSGAPKQMGQASQAAPQGARD